MEDRQQSLRHQTSITDCQADHLYEPVFEIVPESPESCEETALMSMDLSEIRVLPRICTDDLLLSSLGPLTPRQHRL